MSLLTVRNMSKRFGGLTAVDDVSITVNRGEIYGLIGPNGAGKTTCFNLITGLYPADSGEFSIADKPYFPKQIEKVTAAGMNAAEKVALGELLIRIRDDGKTLLMIEHDVKLVMGICDRLTVLDYGKTLATGTPESVRRDPAVIAAWLGGNAHV